jgi:hypothetical protein
MRTLRMTTRRWIFAVAIVAVSMGFVVEAKRELRLASQYGLRAQFHAREGRLHAGAFDGGRFRPPAGVSLEGFHAFSIPGPEVAAYHAKMREKYERAASRPWASVEPDPPEPR